MMKRFLRTFTLLVCLVMAALVVFASPQRALASSHYDIDTVSITAELHSDGSLHVTEDRTYNFDRDFNGVFWRLPAGDIETKTSVESAGIVKDGSYIPFKHVESASNGDDRVYTTSQTEQISDNIIKLKLFYPVKDGEKVVYRINYVIKGIATAWKDTGELYWKFVSDGWDVPSYNVSATITLPVPKDEKDPQADIRAWAHGPLDGKLELISDGAKFFVHEVGTSEFAEARIVFPVSWLSKMKPQKEAKLAEIKDEEATWAEEANKSREHSRMFFYTILSVAAVLVTVLLMLMIWLKKRYKKTHTPQFTDIYFRDIPDNLHPAVLCFIDNYDFSRTIKTPGGINARMMDGLSASIIRLSDIGSLRLEKYEKARLVRKPKKLWKLTGLATYKVNPGEELTDIDKATLKFMKTVSPSSIDEFCFEDMKAFQKDHPIEYLNAFNLWVNSISLDVAERGYLFDPYPPHFGLAWFSVMTGFFAVLGSALMAILASETSREFTSIVMPLCAFTGIVSIILSVVSMRYSANCKEISANGLEVYVKTKALKRWFKDFTRLKEAVPTDVVLWNKLLVAATALGVAQEVVENLKVAAPEVLDSPDFAMSYLWYYGMWGSYTPYRAMSTTSIDAYSNAYAKVNGINLAGSSNSSAGGFGGGFSVGGGGGFGGGGGGGAF